MEPTSEKTCMTTEMRNPGTMDLDTMTPLEIVTVMNLEDGFIPGAVRKHLKEIARAAGVSGMLAGQTLDVTLAGTAPDTDLVRRIHEGKTAALLTAPLTAGLILAGAEENQIEAGRVYGYHLGIAFQIEDDLLDLAGDPALMGKTLGKDQAEGKLTWPACVGVSQAEKDAEEHIALAVKALDPFGEKADFLRDLAFSTLNRTQ